jgi:hypothetical protein
MHTTTTAMGTPTYPSSAPASPVGVRVSTDSSRILHDASLHYAEREGREEDARDAVVEEALVGD